MKKPIFYGITICLYKESALQYIHRDGVQGTLTSLRFVALEHLKKEFNMEFTAKYSAKVSKMNGKKTYILNSNIYTGHLFID